MKSYKLLMLLGCMALLFAACAPNTVINPSPISKFDQQARLYAQAPKEYIIEVGDTLDVKFMYNAELNELGVPVRPDGRISLQLAHDVPAAGMTPTQLRAVLNEKLAVELKKPETAIIVRTFGGQKVFVDGEVAYAGPVDFKGRMTLFQAIGQARGLRETARLSNIIVIRKDFEGAPMSTNIDLRKVIDGTDLGQDIALMPYDIVYVPKSQIANWDKFVNEYLNLSIPSRFPEFGSFANPYQYAFGGFTKIYPDTISPFTTGAR